MHCVLLGMNISHAIFCPKFHKLTYPVDFDSLNLELYCIKKRVIQVSYQLETNQCIQHGKRIFGN